MLAQCAARSSLLCLQCKVWACALDLDFLALVLSRHTCVCAQGKGSRSVNSFCPLVPLTNVPNNICALNQVHVSHRIVNKYFFPFEVIFKILVIKGGDEVINVKLSISWLGEASLIGLNIKSLLQHPLPWGPNQHQIRKFYFWFL